MPTKMVFRQNPLGHSQPFVVMLNPSAVTLNEVKSLRVNSVKHLGEAVGRVPRILSKILRRLSAPQDDQVGVVVQVIAAE